MTGRYQTLDEALEAVTDRGLDPDSPGGAVALSYLLQQNMQVSDESARLGPPNADDADEDPAATLASWAGASRESVMDVFEFADHGVRLGAPSGRLPKSKAKRQRVLVLLKLAADRVAYGAQEVPASQINEIAAHYACLDQNLPQNVAGRSSLVTRRGTRGAFRYRITQMGLDRAKELISSLAAGDAVRI